MIINKITTGFVIQQFNTTTRKWVRQDFIAGEVAYENEIGDSVESPDNEPYLPFDMVQPT